MEMLQNYCMEPYGSMHEIAWMWMVPRSKKGKKAHPQAAAPIYRHRLR